MESAGALVQHQRSPGASKHESEIQSQRKTQQAVDIPRENTRNDFKLLNGETHGLHQCSQHLLTTVGVPRQGRAANRPRLRRLAAADELLAEDETTFFLSFDGAGND